MGYLICDNCDIYYEIDEDFNDFDTCENCGEKLKFYSSFDDYYNKKNDAQRERIAVGKGYAEKKALNIIPY